MSAYIVEKETIDRVVFALRQWCGFERDPTALGRELWALNIESVHGRYYTRTSALFPAEPDPPSYIFDMTLTSKVQGYKSLRCWLYQSCEGKCNETPLYREVSEATEALAHEIVSDLPAYKETTWR